MSSRVGREPSYAWPCSSVRTSSRQTGGRRPRTAPPPRWLRPRRAPRRRQHARLALTPDDAAEQADRLPDRQRRPAHHVPLPGRATRRRQQVALGAVGDVDQAQARVDEGGQPSVQVVEQELRRAAAPARPLHRGRVDAHDLEARAAGRSSTASLGLHLRPLVVRQERAAVGECLSSRPCPSPRRAWRRRTCTRAAHARLRRRAHDVAGPSTLTA